MLTKHNAYQTNSQIFELSATQATSVGCVDDFTEGRDHLRLASSRPLSLINGRARTDPSEEPLAEGTPRPALTSIAVRVDGDRLESTATLALNGRVLTGTSIGDAAERTAIVAAATLGAVASLLDCEAVVETASVVYLTGHEVALTVVRIEASGSSSVLVGSALVRGDVEDATARSVLSALNRRLSR